MTVPTTTTGASSVDDTPKSGGTRVGFAPTAAVSDQETPTDLDPTPVERLKHTSGRYSFTPTAPMSQDQFDAALNDFDVTADPYATDAELTAHAAEYGLTLAILGPADAPEGLLTEDEAFAAEVEGVAQAQAVLEPLLAAISARVTSAELCTVIESTAGYALPEVQAILTAQLAVLGDGVSVGRAAKADEYQRHADELRASGDQVGAGLVTEMAAEARRPRGTATPPAPGVVPPPTVTAPTPPPAPAAPDPATQELNNAEIALEADPDDVFAAAVIDRHGLRLELDRTLDPYLRRIPDLDDRNGEVIAAMKLTRAARTEAVDAALSGRLIRLDLKIRDLVPTSRDARTAWERLREPEVAGDRYVDGGSFIHSISDTTPAVWGSGEDVLWAEGEGLIVAGPQGVGKSTLAGNLVAAMITGSEVLGYPVKRVDRTLYLAMDRPKQIARALRRQLGGIPEDELTQRLVVWQGPPPEDFAAHPERLLAMAEKAGANVVIVDSLKDAALGLSSDEVGAGWNRARQTVLAAGIDVLELHHDRKANDTTAPAIEKLYGSVWITSGAGSVIHLGGEPGDPIVRLSHLKQPASEVGPFMINHDGSTGTMAIYDKTDLLTMCRQPGGTSVRDAAAALYEVEKPTDAHIERTRRKLKKLEAEGLVSAVTVGGATMYTAASYNSFQVPQT